MLQRGRCDGVMGWQRCCHQEAGCRWWWADGACGRVGMSVLVRRATRLHVHGCMCGDWWGESKAGLAAKGCAQCVALLVLVTVPGAGRVCVKCTDQSHFFNGCVLLESTRLCCSSSVCMQQRLRCPGSNRSTSCAWGARFGAAAASAAAANLYTTLHRGASLAPHAVTACTA